MDEVEGDENLPSASTIMNRFGSWNNALQEADLRINQTRTEDGYSGRQYYKDVKSRCSCANCGEDRSAILTFHHRNPDEKEFPLARDNQRCPESLYQEMKKCLVLCKNCHGVHHSDQHEFDATELPRQDIPGPNEVFS